MKSLLNKLVIGLITLYLLPFSVFASDDFNDSNDEMDRVISSADVRLGVEALDHGNYLIAKTYLERALAEHVTNDSLFGGLNDDDFNIVIWALSHVYWETGHDHALIRHTEKYLPREEQDLWWCRVSERRGVTDEARQCWEGLGEKQKAMRVMRSQAIIDEFVGAGRYGYP